MIFYTLCDKLFCDVNMIIEESRHSFILIVIRQEANPSFEKDFFRAIGSRSYTCDLVSCSTTHYVCTYI